VRSFAVRTIAVFLLLAAAVLVVVMFARWLSAREEHEQARFALVTVTSQVEELRSLRARLGGERIAASGSRADALAEVADTLAAAGLPDGAMRSLDEQNDPPLTNSSLLRLTSITPAELGAFLARLASDRPHFTVTRIELTHPRRAEGNRYDSNMLLVRTYQSQPVDQEDAG